MTNRNISIIKTDQPIYSTHILPAEDPSPETAVHGNFLLIIVTINIGIKEEMGKQSCNHSKQGIRR